MSLHSPSQHGIDLSIIDQLDSGLGSLGNFISKFFTVPLELVIGGKLWESGHHHLPEGTDKLNRALQINHVAGEIVCEKLECSPEQLPYSGDLISELHLLAMVLLSPETTKEARYEIQKELKKQLGGIRLSGGDESEERYRHEVDHAWEGVFHWTHTLLGSGLAQNTAPEKPLYLKALRRPPEGGDIQVKAQAFSNPRLAEILMPELLELRAEEKNTYSPELIMKELEGQISYTINRVRRTASQRITQSPEDQAHEKPAEGGFTNTEKFILGTLALSTLVFLLYVLSLGIRD
jgi:hypothetical protein